MKYTKKEIEKMLKTNLLYQKECVNYRGKSDEKEYYIEIIADYILKNSEKLKNNRELVYHSSIIRDTFVFDHNSNDIEYTEGSNRYETNLCRFLFKNHSNLEKLGKVFEYEVNIVEGNHTNIDLVSYNENENTIYIIEVKGTKDSKNKNNNKYTSIETLLRCILEISTYYNSINQKIKKFIDGMIKAIEKNLEIIIEEKDKIKVELAILVPDDSEIDKEFKNNDYSKVNALLKNSATIINEMKEITVCKFSECGIGLELIKNDDYNL